MVIKNKKNKKAWVKILESFLSIVLILGVLSLILVQDSVRRQEEIAEQIKVVENSILQKIQINETLRQDVLILSGIPMESGNSNFPERLINLTNSSISSKLNCSMKICEAEFECSLDNLPLKKEIYSSSVLITGIKDAYDPRQLNIFCWRN